MLATPTAQVKAQMHVKLLSAELSRPSLGHWCWQGLGRSIILAVVAIPTGYVGRCATNLSRDDHPDTWDIIKQRGVPCTGEFIGGAIRIHPATVSLSARCRWCTLQLSNGSLLPALKFSRGVVCRPADADPSATTSPRAHRTRGMSRYSA